MTAFILQKTQFFFIRGIKKISPVYAGFPVELTDKSTFLKMQIERLNRLHFNKEETGLLERVKNFMPQAAKLCLILIEEHALILKWIKQIINLPDAAVMNNLAVFPEKLIRKENCILFEPIQRQVPENVLSFLQKRRCSSYVE